MSSKFKHFPPSVWALVFSNSCLILFNLDKKCRGKMRMSPSHCNTAVVERMWGENNTQWQFISRRQKIQLGFSSIMAELKITLNSCLQRQWINSFKQTKQLLKYTDIRSSDLVLKWSKLKQTVLNQLKSDSFSQYINFTKHYYNSKWIAFCQLPFLFQWHLVFSFNKLTETIALEGYLLSLLSI